MRTNFWITNISKKDINLYDLGVNVKSMTSINLLDPKHYFLTESQIEKSLESGSLRQKLGNIIIRESAPKLEKKKIAIDKYSAIPTRLRSLVEIEEEYYQELDINNDILEEEEIKTKANS